MLALDSADEDDDNCELSNRKEQASILTKSASNTNNFTRNSVSPTDELMGNNNSL